MRQETPRYTRSHRLLKIYISLLSLRPIIQIQFRNKLTSHFYESLTIKSNYSFSRIPTISNIENFLTFNTLTSPRNEEKKKKTKNPLRNVEKTDRVQESMGERAQWVAHRWDDASYVSRSPPGKLPPPLRPPYLSAAGPAGAIRTPSSRPALAASTGGTVQSCS